MKGTFSNLFKNFFESEKVAGLLLLCCTIVSITIANSSYGSGYVAFMQNHVYVEFIPASLNLSIEHWVNDGLMTIFFLMVGLEVERELYNGELSDIKKAILPVVAAVGGMLIPSVIHFLLNKGTPSQSGFAISMATDIAFALGILSLAGNRIPASLKVFLAALAIIDDIGAIIVIAFFYTKTIFFVFLLSGVGIWVVLLVLNRMGIRNLFFYLIPGMVMWYCFLRSGVHPTISGVMLAFALPFDSNDNNNVSIRLQNFLHYPVAYFIVPVFALVNTAIVLPQGFFQQISSPNSLGIILGLFVGKVLGIVLFPLVLIKLGWASLQEEITLPFLIGIGFLGGIGFTMSMFISNLAFDDVEIITASKLSILIGSALSALVGFIILKKAK